MSGSYSAIVNFGKTVSVLAYGVKTTQNGGTAANAVANATAINKALSENNVVLIPANCTIYVPISKPTNSIAGNDTTLLAAYSGIYVPPGKSLIGEDKNSSILITNHTGTNQSAGCSLIADSNSIVKNLTFDGNKALAATATPAGNWSNWLVRAFPGSSGVRFENLITKNVAAGNSGQESFGISCYLATNAIVIDCEMFGVFGTGLHFDGDYTLSILCDNCKAIRVKSHDNDWMGMSNYGAKNIQIIDCEFYNNVQNGVNIEWVNNIIIDNLYAYNNGIGGVGTYGQVSNFQLRNSRIEFNATNAAETAATEIVIRPGSWYKAASGQANAARGILYNAEIVNCKITPSAGKYHLNVLPFGGAAPTDGGITTTYPIQSLPNQILIDCVGSESWSFPTDSANPKLQGLKFKGLKTLLPKTTMKTLPSWTGTLTKAAYSGTGKKSVYAQTLTANTQFQSIYQPVDASKTYLLTIRYLSPGVNSWTLYLQQLSVPATKYLTSQITNLATDAGIWFESQLIFTVPTTPVATDWVVVLQSNDSVVPTVLVVDYITIEEIVGANSEIVGTTELATNMPSVTLKGTVTTSLLRAQDSSSSGSVLYIDGTPINNTQTAAVYFGRNSNASDFQINIYQANTGNIVHNLSASDSFFAQRTGNFGIGMTFQEGTSEKLCVKGAIRVQGATNPGYKFGANVTVKLAADAAPGATSLSLVSNNGSNLRVLVNTLLTFGGTQVTVTSSTNINPTTGTAVPISGTISSTIVSGTVSSGFSAKTDSDRWNIELDGVAETGSNVGSNLRVTRWNDAGSNATSGGASLGTVLTFRRSTGAVEIPLLTATTETVTTSTITTATIGSGGNTDFLTLLGNLKLQQGVNTFTRFQNLDGGTGGDALLYIDPIPQAATNAIEARFFRNSNSALGFLVVYKGNNTSTVNCRLGSTGSSYLNVDNGNIGLGTATTPYKVTISGATQHSGGNLGFFGVTPAAQPVGGVATAAATYGTNEQTMLQAVYNAMRTLGLLS